jgi:hypothetical protein
LSLNFLWEGITASLHRLRRGGVKRFEDAGVISASRARAAAARALAGAGRYLGPDGLGKRTGGLPID